jgi:predicted O-methyltransferase YrrM
MSVAPVRPNFGPKVQAELERLYADALLTDPPARWEAQKRGLVNDSDPVFYEAMSKAYLPVTPDFGALLYLLVKMTRARSIIEFGMSFGVSTIHLAAALQDLSGGKIITTEFIPAKAEQARRNLAAAELDAWVEIRTGDARESLRADLPDRIDLLFLDGPKFHYFAIYELLAPRLVSGSIIVSDNSEMEDAADYLAYVRDPASGFTGCLIETSVLEYQLRHEILMKK